ncbi:FadR/GntR family transcriptional regulator [Thalassospira lucentensis]|uniref:FadR/GntR family transcriptional regulator n=1 Tax=Thalassospira lucentensis TaxID=168935 RepID=UPI003D2F0E72
MNNQSSTNETKLTDPVGRLRNYITEGGFSQGVKLPPERHLTDELGMTRTTLRKALDALERDGLIWRHVGKGTFMADKSQTRSVNETVQLGRQLTPFKMMRARLTIEPSIAREAAVNASGDTLAGMRRALDRSRKATTWEAYEIEDDAFHRSVAEACDNLLLMAMFDQLNEVRRAVAWGNVERKTVRPSLDHVSFAQHEAIAAAIVGRQPQDAYDAMRAHLLSVSSRLFGET